MQTATVPPAVARPRGGGAVTPQTATLTRSAPDTTVAARPAPARPPAGSRDALLDLLRAVALVRVFIWHTFPEKWLTAIAAMPVMFFVAGTMLPAVSDLRGYATMLRRRSRRLLVPFWAYGLVLWTALFVLPPAAGSSTSPAPRW